MMTARSWRRISALLLVAAVCLVVAELPPSSNVFDSFAPNVCNLFCTLDMPAEVGPPGGQLSCGQDNVTRLTKFCADSVFMLNYCLVAQDVTGIQYAGACGCANDCLSATGQGSCVNSACECLPGWGGKDCSQVVCPDNACSGLGSCVSTNITDYCACSYGHSGSDCSIENLSSPPVTETVPSTQYNEWDDYGNNHPIFNTSTVAQIKLYTSEILLQEMLDPKNKETSTYIKADMWFYNSNIEQFLASIGFRLKGNVSRNMAKKSWKLNFNHFLDDDDNDWLQIDRLDLKGFQTDNAKLRDPLSLDVDYSMNGVTQRMGWAQLSINDMSFGHYLILESIGKKFLKSRFGTNDGPLYKCNANLLYYGSNVTFYQNSYSYTPETDEAESEEGWESLVNLLAVLNQTSTANLPSALEPIFDVDLFIRTFVFEVATGQWDGLRDSNNYYLFQDPTDMLWKFIRHDMDASFGSLPAMSGINVNDIYRWADEPSRGSGYFLYDRILSVPQYRLAYTLYMQELFNGFFNPQDFSVFWRRAMNFQTLNTIPVIQDYAGYLDCGWTYATFVESWYTSYKKPTTWLGQNQIMPAVKKWVEARKISGQFFMEEYFAELHANNTVTLP